MATDLKKKPEKTVAVPRQSIDAAKARPGPSARYADRQQRHRPSYNKGQVSTGGVLAEIDTALQAHHQQVQPKLTESFTAQVTKILPSLGVKNAPPELIAYIANNAANHSLEMLATVQDKEQIPQVLADSLTQSIAVTPEITSKVQVDEVRAYKNLVPQMEIVTQNQASDLEKAAVLGNIAAVASFTQPSTTIQAVAHDQVEQLSDIEAPLAAPIDKNSVKAATEVYVKSYVDNFQQEISAAIGGEQTPNLEQLNQLKENIYKKTKESFKTQVDTSSAEKSGLNLDRAIDNTATLLSLKPLTVEKANLMGMGTAAPNTLTFAKSGGTMGFGLGLAMATSTKIQQQTIYSLIAYNNPKLEGTISALQSRQNELDNKLKLQRALSYHERLEYKNNKDRLRFYQNAQDFAKNQPKNFRAYLSYWGKNKIGRASGIAWGAVSPLTSLPGVPFKVIGGLGSEIRTFRPLLSPRMMAGGMRDDLKMNYQFARYMVTHPHTALKNEMLMYGKAFGALGFGSGNVRGLLNLKSTLKNAFSPQAFAGGMGMALSTGFLKNAAKASGALFGGLAMYFMGLGKAAFTGFMAGAAVGGTAGAIYGGYLGFQLGVALAPFTFGLSIPILTALGALTGFFLGGAIAGSAGALIAMGFYSGSTTAVTTGLGVGAGGFIGAIAGQIIGAAIGAAVVGWIPIVGPVLAPFGAVLGGMIGATVGAAVGAAVGGLIGYAVGKVISAIGVAASLGLAGGFFGFFFGGPIGALAFAATGWLLGGGWNTIRGFFAGGISGATGLAGSLLGGLSGLSSALWGGATAGAGGLWGGMVGAANFAAGGISAMASIPSGIAGMSVAAAGTTMSVLGITAVTAVAVSFSSLESELQNAQTGDNQFYSINKTADKNHLENPPPGTTLKFTITLTAKEVKLLNVTVTDRMSVVGKENRFDVTTDADGKTISKIDCPQELEPRETCRQEFTVNVDEGFIDSIISNTVQVNATPEGQPEKADSKTAMVTVGNPPADCPRGWPSSGVITQGPDGATSHGKDSTYGFDIEALDIGTPVGTPVYATVTGKVTYIDTARGNLNQTIGVRPDACAGLEIVYYQHLSAINVSMDDQVTFGQNIGATGSAYSGAHTHYQFNNAHNRSFKLEPPHIPALVPRDCNNNAGCNPPGPITAP